MNNGRARNDEGPRRVGGVEKDAVIAFLEVAEAKAKGFRSSEEGDMEVMSMLSEGTKFEGPSSEAAGAVDNREDLVVKLVLEVGSTCAAAEKKGHRRCEAPGLVGFDEVD